MFLFLVHIVAYIFFKVTFCMNWASVEYSKVPEKDMEGSSTMDHVVNNTQEDMPWLSI